MVMNEQSKKWVVVDKLKNKNPLTKDIVKLLFSNRGINNRKDIEVFTNPLSPEKLTLNELQIQSGSVEKAIKRIQKAIEGQEHIVIYGDYDADGICATAILWETLYSYTNNVLPHIPDRFSEGYGINPSSIEKIKKENPKVSLIITVDNGIVAFEAVKKANSLGIDVIITDHHRKEAVTPNAYSIVHSDKISGSGVAYFFAREIEISLQSVVSSRWANRSKRKLPKTNDQRPSAALELAAIGTVADQLPLIGPNRSIAKFGLMDLSNTTRLGLKELYRESALSNGVINPKTVGTYEVNYVIAPRLNAMGRLKHAIDSLRLLCTTDHKKAAELADVVGSINRQRQKIVEEVLVKARLEAEKGNENSAIVISGNYHEGVIGLAAGKLVEDFGRPAIVFSVGKEKSKASARSIPGFNIIEEIKKCKTKLLGAGGHPMAAGLSIKTSDIKEFKKEFEKRSTKLLTKDLLTKTLKIDCELEFNQITMNLAKEVELFAPFGIGNPGPVFLTKNVSVVDSKVIGKDKKHLKISLEKAGVVVNAIAFNFADTHKLEVGDKLDLVYSIEENEWNGNVSLQLKIKDLKLHLHD